jgi:hypothetical protein
MDIELLSQFCQRLVALDGCDCHLGFESRCVVPADPFHTLAALCAVVSTVWIEQDHHLRDCPKIRRHLSDRCFLNTSNQRRDFRDRFIYSLFNTLHLAVDSHIRRQRYFISAADSRKIGQLTCPGFFI